MGVRCIKTQQPNQLQVPIFLSHNMVKMRKNTDPHIQYEFLQKIGRGSFSEVFKVRNILTGNLMAMKKIERRKNIRLQKLIINEFNILRQLDHPSIMKMYEYFEDNDFIYLLAELCPGKELFDLIIENKYLAEDTARKIFFEISAAVRHMHENNFMHRDLKPQNIIYDPVSDTLKIVDLGSSLEFATSECAQRKRVGTSYYIAPQVLARFYNQKCDVWSLGVILYIMLSGQPPFKGSQDAQILDKVKNATLEFKRPIWGLISREAKDLIKSMVQRNVKKRKSIEEVLKDSWFDTVLQQKSRLSMSMTETSQKSMVNCLSNIKSFKDLKSKAIQEGIITFIVNFVQSNEDAVELQRCFKALDLNGDGVLSQEQLCQGIMKYLKTSKREASAIAEAVFKKVDTNKSGFIDYSQFLIAATNFEMTISQDNLDIAFEYLDTDKSGKISASELKNRLGENISEDSYRQMLKSFDVNSDGQISKEQFRTMMKQLASL